MVSFGSIIRPLLGFRRGDSDEVRESPTSSESPPPPLWSCYAASARGARHINNGQPNQDAVGIGHLRSDGIDVSFADEDVLRAPCRTPFFVAVSDGHGSTRHFRSGYGSQFAVEAALDTLSDAIREESEQHDSGRVEHLLRNQAGVLLKTWRRKVREHIDTAPFDSVHQAFLDRQVEERIERAHGRRRPEEIVRSEQEMAAYGATLLAAVITDSYTGYVQIGDGDIATVRADGLVERPVPDDEALLGTTTTSLCTAAAEHDFRIRVVPHGGSPPALVVLCTDGYEQSFADEASFLRSVYDYFELFRSDEGRDGIAKHLHAWMREVTLEGSGDDTTIALVANSNTVTSHDEPVFRISGDTEQPDSYTPADTSLCDTSPPNEGEPTVGDSSSALDDPPKEAQHDEAHRPGDESRPSTGGSSREDESPATADERIP